jgi:hypothetical protein
MLKISFWALKKTIDLEFVVMYKTAVAERSEAAVASSNEAPA